MNICPDCKTEFKSTGTIKRCDICRDKRRRLKLRRQYFYKYQVYSMLGGKCCYCGIDDFRVLSIDHVNKDGSNDIAAKEGDDRNSRWYIEIYNQIIQQGRYHKDLQLLCMNCHVIKDSYNYVPFIQYCEARVHPLRMVDFKRAKTRKPPKSN